MVRLFFKIFSNCFLFIIRTWPTGKSLDVKRELVLTDQGWMSQSALWSIFCELVVWLTLSSWCIIICLNCSALTKRFKELMTEFQVTLEVMLFFSVVSFFFDLSLWYNVSDSKTKDPRGVSWGCGKTSHYRFGYLAYKLAKLKKFMNPKYKDILALWY